MDASAPPITDVIDIVSAEEVCEYTYKVELIEKDKISLVIFNTNTGIKYQTYIEEYSDLWDTLKVNFQHNFPLCLKMLRKALLDKDPSFTVNVLHKIDYVILQLTFINDMMGFTIELNVNQYKKDNLQESVNRLQYKQSQLEQENKSLKGELQSVHQEIKELKRIINLLGDGFSYNNALKDPKNVIVLHSMTDLNIYKKTEENGIYGRGTSNSIKVPKTPSITNPFASINVANKIAGKIFEECISEYNLSYSLDRDGYNWSKLLTMMEQNGISNEKIYWRFNKVYSPYDNSPSESRYRYDFTWKSFKELFDIKI